MSKHASDKPNFIYLKAKKTSGETDAVFYACGDKETAVVVMNYKLVQAGKKPGSFFKPHFTHLHIVDDLPAEEELDFTWCERYQLGTDNLTWERKPDSTGSSVNNESASMATSTDNECQNGNATEQPQLTIVPTMPLQHRILAQLIGGGEYLYHVDAAQKAEILRLEMDTENAWVQNMITAAKNVEPFKKAIDIDIHRAVKAYKTVFPADQKSPDIPTVKRFFEEFFATEYINRGLLVKEWIERLGNHQDADNVSTEINPITTTIRREYKQTWKTLDEQLAIAFWPGDVEAGKVEGKILRWAKTEIIGKDREDWKRFSAAMRKQEDALRYDCQTIFGLVRERPDDIHKNPIALNQYIDEYLTTRGKFECDQPEKVHALPQTRIMSEEGKSDDEDKPQSSVALADEPATPETVEPDTTEHHQNTQPLDAESQVDIVDAAYQKIRAELHEALANIPPKNPVDVGKQLAAARGESIDGISDPSDPKWVPGIPTRDASDESEKDEVTTAPELVAPEQEAVTRNADGTFDVSALFPEPSNQTEKTETEPETERDEETQEKNKPQKTAGDTVLEGKTIVQPDAGSNDANKAANPVVVMNGNNIRRSTSKTWHHLMIDLETMGTNINTPIIVIACVLFDPQTGEIGPVFYKVISLTNAMKSGAIPDGGTIEWWLKQSSEARSALLVDQIPLDDALLQLREFIDENSDGKFIQVWGNGATFDNAILRRSYERLSIPCPWRYYNDRDVRTVVELGKAIGFDARTTIPFEGVRHNALDDARHQVKYLAATIQKLIPNQADF
jgi:DNA polymerase III, epsilon subunit and related 3''-5'' exonucleases